MMILKIRYEEFFLIFCYILFDKMILDFFDIFFILSKLCNIVFQDNNEKKDDKKKDKDKKEEIFNVDLFMQQGRF